MDLLLENPSPPDVENEGDEFYEEIEAPKFVDFKVLDRYFPEDRYWFCMRVGCDQKHEEEMDDDKISQNFALRVMAARSPNVKLRKALNRKCPSSSMKCPFTVPAKPSKPRLLKTPVVSSITQKLKDAENHKSVSNNNSKRTILSPKSLTTTPRTQKGTSNRVPFRTASNNLKAIAIEGLKKTTTAGKKALVFKSLEIAVKKPVASKQKPVKKAFREIRRDYSRPWCVNIKRKANGSPKSNKNKVADSTLQSKIMKKPRNCAQSDQISRFEKSENSERAMAENSGCGKEKSDGPEEKMEIVENFLQDSQTFKGDNHENEAFKEDKGNATKSMEYFRKKIVSADEDKENATNAMENLRKESISADDGDKENAINVMDNLRKESVSADDGDKENATKAMKNFSKEKKVSAKRLLNFNCNGSGRMGLCKERVKAHKRPKPTSPKPFRLRTGERMIVKETAQAHLERGAEVSTARKEGGMVACFQDESYQKKTGKELGVQKNQNRIDFSSSSKELQIPSKKKRLVTEDSRRRNGSKELQIPSKEKRLVTKDSRRPNGVLKGKAGDLEPCRQLRVIKEEKPKRNPSSIPYGAMRKTQDKPPIISEGRSSAEGKRPQRIRIGT